MTPPSSVQAPKRLLVPVDLAETSASVAAFASEFAEKLGAELTLFHVWEPPPFAPVESLYIVVAGDRRTLADHLRDECQEQLGTVLPGVARVTGRKVAIGDAAGCILEEADKGGYDFVVIGTHGRKGLTRLALGSVAEKVLRRSPIPVLVVPTESRKEDQR
jgi:universal stress protein A